MKKNAFDPVRARIWALTGLMGLCLLAFAGVMYYTQILHGEENRAKSLASNAASETVEASRGIITDRNGKVLVSNRLTYTLIFSAKDFENDQDLNAAILRLTDLCTENNTVWNDTLPLSKTAPYSYTDAQDSEGFALFLKNKSIPYSKLSQVTPTLQPDRFMAKLRELFKIDSSYTDDQARTIAGVRYELAVKSLTDAQYVFADDVSVELISQTADGQYQGVSTGTSSARVYNTEYAAHVLGRLSPIYYEDWVGDPENGVTGYRDMEGYSMNSLVGREGAEKAFESYLHGTKGTRIITTNEEGKITGELYTKEPQPGGTVALTLDIDVQEDTEKSLAQTIEAMTAKDGIVRGGAAVVVGVGSGEVLAMASYPTYNLSTFDQDYSKLVSDTVGTPLLNRAIGGAYAPGSTFKPCTAVAALESGIITPSSTIVDRGVYDYYKSPQPRCWIYNEYGGTHGRVNVSQAITVSCNYFFYEVGRLTGIKTLADYARQFGLGEYTGIEIGGAGSAEAKGSMATPEFAERNGLEWTDGQTLTAAIGQSYDLFTPLQLAALTAAGAFIRIPIGISVITLQFLFTAMAGVLLGPGGGALSQGVYVALGLVGLPIFTAGGGFGYVLQPSFGFLLGLIPAAAVIGGLSRRSSSPVRLALACGAGLAVLYAVGVPYMALILNGYLGKGISAPALLWSGMLIYLPGDAAKIAVTALLCPVLRRRIPGLR